jgi:hypothetical protein
MQILKPTLYTLRCIPPSPLLTPFDRPWRPDPKRGCLLQLEAEQKATARKQQLLEETRRRAEDDAKASEREMADVRAAFAEEKRAREVEHLKVCQRLEGSVTELEGKAKGLEAKLRESERREEDLRRDLEIALQRAAQAEQTGAWSCGRILLAPRVCVFSRVRVRACVTPGLAAPKGVLPPPRLTP